MKKRLYPLSRRRNPLLVPPGLHANFFEGDVWQMMDRLAFNKKVVASLSLKKVEDLLDAFLREAENRAKFRILKYEKHIHPFDNCCTYRIQFSPRISPQLARRFPKLKKLIP